MNLRRLTSATAFALVTAVSAPLYAQDNEVSAETVLASVNGVEIKLGHVIVAVQGLPPQFQSIEDDQLLTAIVTQLVQQELLSQSASEPSRAAVFELENQERITLATGVLDQIERDAATPEALQQKYEERIAQFAPSEEFNAAHILVATEDEAKAIVEELAEGADFATLAQERSTGPSGPNGGDLGWFGRGMMVPSFEDAVISLELGAVSDPVETQFGWHVIQLNETRIANAPSLDELKEELSAEIGSGAIEAELGVLEGAAEVVRSLEIDPAVIRNEQLRVSQIAPRARGRLRRCLCGGKIRGARRRDARGSGCRVDGGRRIHDLCHAICERARLSGQNWQR